MRIAFPRRTRNAPDRIFPNPKAFLTRSGVVRSGMAFLAALATAGTAAEWLDPLPSARARITTAQFLDGYRVLA